MKGLATCFLLILGWCAFGQAAEDTVVSRPKYSLPIENEIPYRGPLQKRNLDYNLEPLAGGSFKLIFVSQPTDYVRIQIYDIIGNLILEEDNRYTLNSEIEYNFNEKNKKIYVVKVESGNDNLVKKINSN